MPQTCGVCNPKEAFIPVAVREQLTTLLLTLYTTKYQFFLFDYQHCQHTVKIIKP